jgi:hypothetical protein
MPFASHWAMTLLIALLQEWLDTQGVNGGGAADKNAGTIIEALQPLIENGKLRIPRGGYILRRGRGRVIIERPEAD